MTAHIPIIALSANALHSDIANGLAAGFFGYLTKPIKLDEFMDHLDLALKSTTVGLVSATVNAQTGCAVRAGSHTLRFACRNAGNHAQDRHIWR